MVKDCLIGLRDSLFLLRVCRAMYRLNRGAKESEHKEAIYKHKTMLIRWLYEHKESCTCTEARRQDQVFCWGTRLRGGVYRRVPLYKFIFHVETWVFTWHQPVEVVDWPVQETGEPHPDWEGATWHGGQIDLTDLWTVKWFLVTHGLLPIGALAPDREEAKCAKDT